jgi:DNA polymerase-3 subunit alpha (Gram-positive type)
LQGLGAGAAKNLMAARTGDPFLSHEDLKIRAGISKSVVEILEEHGCLNGMDTSSQISMF